MATGVIIAKHQPLVLFDTRNVGIRYLNVLKKYEKLIKADYYRTTKTWKEHDPIFQSKITFARANPELKVWTNDQVYYELDTGTDVRYATMTSDPLFLPKTKVGVLDSFPGRGGLAYYDPNIPRPGIEARLFSVTITNKYEKDLFAELDDATRKGVAARKGRR